MKWFKHLSKSRFDAKIMRIIRKHGLRGYGLYFAIVENIAFDLEPDSPNPELEQTARDIADFFNEDTIKVEEIVQDCVAEGLLEIHPETKRIMCLKILTHLDNTMSQNPQIKAILDNFKKLEATEIPLKQTSLDYPILDKQSLSESNTVEKSKPARGQFIPPTLEELKEYLKSESVTSIDPEYFIDYYETRGWKVKGGGLIKSWKACVNTWKKNNFKGTPGGGKTGGTTGTPPPFADSWREKARRDTAEREAVENGRK